MHKQCLTDHFRQGGRTISYWTVNTRWMHKVLLTASHRVDTECIGIAYYFTVNLLQVIKGHFQLITMGRNGLIKIFFSVKYMTNDHS